MQKTTPNWCTEFDIYGNEEGSTMKSDEHTMHIQNTSDDSIGKREDYLKLIPSLYEASITGDWETAKPIFDNHRDMVCFGLNENLETALHVVAQSKETEHTIDFVKNLVALMDTSELELPNKKGNTALWIACGLGNMKAVEIMMKKHKKLLIIRGFDKLLPLSMSALNGQYNIVKSLYNKYKKLGDDQFTYDDKSCVLLQCVKHDMFDIALQIVKEHPELENFIHLLEVLAQKPHALNRVEKNLTMKTIKSTCRFFGVKVQTEAEENTNALELLKKIWGHATETNKFDEIKSLLESRPQASLPEGMLTYSSRILFDAAEAGNTQFIVELLRTYPDLMLEKNDDELTIFHIAVLRRHNGIFNLLYEIGQSRYNIFISREKETKNTMLHLVGKSSKEMAAKTSQASLRMQRELLWFKEVKKMTPSYVREMKNADGLTAYELFAKENELLVTKGLKWTKDCMLVATLIVTIAFAVAFTVPGGYDQEHGLPVFIRQPSFLVFVIADVLSLFSSSTSLLVFLSVLTSHQDLQDFMHSLSQKLMIGLLTLFFSVATMMVTFSASFFVLYDNELKWVPFLTATLATVPVIVFGLSQIPILVDMYRSMRDSNYIFKPNTRMLYTKKQMLRSNKSTSWMVRMKASLKGFFSKGVDAPSE